MNHYYNDVFISYKNDNVGDNLGRRLADTLRGLGYSVYFNPDETQGEKFDERLKDAVTNCKDFLLILSQGCVDQLLRNDEVDYIRDEILTAHDAGKIVIPILLPNVKMPSQEDAMPPNLRFLIKNDYTVFSNNEYDRSPLTLLLNRLVSKKEKDDIYRDTFNDNPDYNVNKEFQTVLAKANAGDVEAMYRVGVMYFYGYTSEDGTCSQRNYDQAMRWFEAVSQSGCPELAVKADFFIAKMYYSGAVSPQSQSYFKSFEYRKKAEADIACAVQVAWMQRDGLGCTYDFNLVRDYFKKIMSGGDDIAKAEYAKFLCTIGECAEAIAVYESMDHLSPDNCYKLGMIYKAGTHQTPPKPDYFRASYYFQNAADNNNIDAAYELALLNFRPFESQRKLFSKALKYFTIAADNGHVEAQYMTGYMLEYGHVSKNINKAIDYYELAAEQGHTLASLQLSLLYQQPECCNYHKAFRHAQKAANNGCAEADFILGNLLLFGRGCVANLNAAKEHYLNAMAHGIYPAKIMLDDLAQKIGSNAINRPNA